MLKRDELLLPMITDTFYEEHKRDTGVSTQNVALIVGVFALLILNVDTEERISAVMNGGTFQFPLNSN